MTMKLKMVLKESNSKIKNDMLKIIFNHIDNAVNSSLGTIKSKTIDLLTLAMKNEPEYNSLKFGQLRMELGIENTDVVDNIINAIVQTFSITKTLRYNTRGLSDGIKITVLSGTDLKSIIGSSDANINDTERGYSLPWLEWLLLRGNETIVQNYSVNYTSNPRSRSGLALMVPSSSSWRIPANFTGTESDNWTTRAISKIGDKISTVIQSNLENYL